MEKNLIKFQAPEDVREFVDEAGKCDFDIDVVYNKVLVDAKSFLGVLSLSANPVYVICHGENKKFAQICRKYAC